MHLFPGIKLGMVAEKYKFQKGRRALKEGEALGSR